MTHLNQEASQYNYRNAQNQQILASAAHSVERPTHKGQGTSQVNKMQDYQKNRDREARSQDPPPNKRDHAQNDA